MIESEGIRISVAPDGSRAIILLLSPSATRTDVEIELEAKGVVAGINWNAIDAAINEANRTNKPVVNIMAARQEPATYAIAVCGGVVAGPAAPHLKELAQFGESLNGPANRQVAGCSSFVCKGDSVFRLETVAPCRDVFGRPLGMRVERVAFDAAAIRVKDDESVMDYCALVDGYVVVTSSGILTIASALLLSEDRMKLVFRVAEVKNGGSKLVEAFLRSWHDTHRDIPAEPLTPDGVTAAMKSGLISDVVVNVGRPPSPGVRGALVFRIASPQGAAGGAAALAADRIDYHERTPFYEVTKGETIAELTLAKFGDPGMDATGEEIAVEEVEQLSLIAGDNVVTEEHNGVLRYSSAIDGIAVLQQDRVDVQRELRVKGDVGPETGNLLLSANIQVDGSVISGFRVACGGNLAVRGCIENGALVECAGNITVDGGLIGEKTKCTAKGNVEVGYIQDSVVRAGGSIDVKSYAYNSAVFTAGDLRVSGAHVTGDERGAVIGGRVCAMKSISVHSVGSFAEKTELVCGVDPDAEAILSRVKQTEPLLARHIALLQMQIGVDVHNPQATIKALSQLPYLRDKMKDHVVELKRKVEERDKLIRALPELEKRAYASDLSTVSVKIQHHCIPDVLVKIGAAVKALHKRQDNACFRLVDGAVVEVKA